MKFFFIVVLLIICSIPLHALVHSKEELNFIKEVNLVREHPKEYITYIKEYVSRYGLPGEKIVSLEVIDILGKMQPLQPLKVSNQIRLELEYFNGVDSINKWVNHGNWKWLVSPHINAGENLIMSCTNTYRNMVIRHLIDVNIPSRGHRKNILNANFNTMAVKRIVFGDESKPFQCRIWWVEEYLEL